MSRSRPTTDFIQVLSLARIPALLLLGTLARAGESHPDSPPQDPDSGVRELYLTHCAACHGESGDGKGTTELDRPARSFLDGGFSFGNTPKALMRTLTNGIPGTPMPAFDEALSERERRQLASYVISLGPEGAPEAPKGTEIVVDERARIVRGMMGPVAQGAPAFPRGVLLGTPDGMSFQYRADDVRLLAVRLGRFVDRRDWANRGGSPLAPLGTIVHLVGGGDPPPTFERLLGPDGIQRRPLGARLLATEERGGTGIIEYGLFDESIEGGRASVATVREHSRALGFRHGAGFVRKFGIEAHTESLRLALDLGASTQREPLDVIGAEALEGGGAGPRWIVTEREDGLFECLGMRVSGENHSIQRRGPGMALPLSVDTDRALEVEVFVLTTRVWNDEVRGALKAEVGR